MLSVWWQTSASESMLFQAVLPHEPSLVALHTAGHATSASTSPPSISCTRSPGQISAGTSPPLVLPLACCWYARPALHRASIRPSSKQMLLLEANVASVCVRVFQMFQSYVASVSMDVAKVDREVSYVAMAVHVCCKRLFQMFHLFFKRMLQLCLSGCYICFTHMLQVFYLDVAYVFQ